VSPYCSQFFESYGYETRPCGRRLPAKERPQTRAEKPSQDNKPISWKLARGSAIVCCGNERRHTYHQFPERNSNPQNSGSHDASGGTFSLLLPQWSTSEGLISCLCLQTLELMHLKRIHSHMDNSQRAKSYRFYYKIITNPLTPNDLKRHRTVSPLKIKIPSKNMRKKQTNVTIIH
jgi:hypothetical protein